MGNVLFGQRCDHPSDESVINLSDNCIEKLMKSPEEQEIIACKKTNSRVEDGEWMKKLKCLDDLHSKESGMLLNDIEMLLKAVEEKIGTPEHPNCSAEDLITCLQGNQRCIIKCEKYINEFIDCVDTARIEAIKRIIKKAEGEETSCDCKGNTENTCTCPIPEENDDHDN